MQFPKIIPRAIKQQDYVKKIIQLDICFFCYLLLQNIYKHKSLKTFARKK